MQLLAEMGAFAKVVDAGGFSQAARLLGLSRSAVSKHVARLEEGLGVRLLHRTTRAMSLTEAGRAVYEQCARLALAAEEATAAAGRLSSAPRGLLRVGASVAFGHMNLVHVLPEFLRRYPEVKLELSLLDRYVDLAEEGYDVVLRLTDDPPEGHAGRRLLDVSFVLCASPAYVEAFGMPAAPCELAGHNCVRQGHPAPVTEWRFARDGHVERVKVGGNAVVTGSEAILGLLLHDVGCGIVPDFLAGPHLESGRLLRLLPEWMPQGNFGRLYALYLPSRQGNPKVRVFIDFLVERLGRS